MTLSFGQEEAQPVDNEEIHQHRQKRLRKAMYRLDVLVYLCIFQIAFSTGKYKVSHESQMTFFLVVKEFWF